MEEAYQEVDISRMLENPKCAVRVTSEYDAKEFIWNAKRAFPDFSKRWGNGETHWDEGVKAIGYTLFDYSATRPSRLTYTDSIEWFIDNGYVIVDYADLRVDIEESEMPIEALFGEMQRPEVRGEENEN